MPTLSHPARTALSALLAAALLVTTLAVSPAVASPLPERSFPAEIDAYARYEGQWLCWDREMPGVVAMRRLLQDAYSANGGGIRRACGVGGRSEHKEGRAYDWMRDARDPNQLKQVEEFLDWLLATDEHGNAHAMARRMGVMYIIWNREVWNAYRPERGWTEYTGAHPHTDHVHISFSWDGAEQRTSYWSGRAVTDNTRRGPAFVDVPRSAYYADAVWWMLQHSITDGYGDSGEFRPQTDVTRAQMAAFLWRMMGRPEGYPPHVFPDVPRRAYYEPAVRWLAAEGLTDGYGDTGTFQPDRVLSRAEMATFLWRLAGEPEDQPRHDFPDVPQQRYFDTAVSWMTAHGITDGVGNTGRFEPGSPVTRAQTAAFLYRTASSRDAWTSAPIVPPTVRFR